MLQRSSKGHGKIHQIQSFLQTRSLHQKLVLLSLVLLVISGFILVHSIVFTKHQMHDATGSEQSKMAQSFAAADKTADTATGPAKQLIDLTPPLSRPTLGHAAWSMLHTIAALFPDDPSKQKQEAMVALLNSIAELYPCATCARHFRAYIREYPIPTPLTRKTISMWLCEAHNSVNVRLEKPSVSCANIEETWPNKLEQDCGCAATDSPTLDPKGPELDKKPTDASGATPTPASDAPSTAEAAAAAAKSARIAEEEERDRQQEKEREAKRKEQERRMEEDARLV